MRLMTLVLTAALLWPVSVSSQEQTQGLFFESGNDLFLLCTEGSGFATSFCDGYVTGVADSVQLLTDRGAVKVACLQQHVDGDQVKDIVMQYLTAHPEQQHLGAAGLVFTALEAAFPCKEQAH
jgi:hypothetical protein